MRTACAYRRPHRRLPLATCDGRRPNSLPDAHSSRHDGGKMTTPVVITFIGRDRPGLVNAISEKVAAFDGTWLESRLAHLAGEFAGIVLVRVPEPNIAS